MRSRVPHVAPLTFAAIVLLLVPANVVTRGGAQRSPPGKLPSGQQVANAGRSLFLVINDSARSATKGGREEIEAFVENFLIRTIAYPVGPSVRRRVATAELAYRQRTQRGVTDGDLVAAVNRGAARYWAPSFVRTNDAQVVLLRQQLDAVVPQLQGLSSEGQYERQGQRLSPAHATFILMFLITQKVSNGAYQVDAGTWVEETRRRMETKQGLARREVHPQVWELPAGVKVLMTEPPSDSGLFTVATHKVLDDLGIIR